MNEHRNRFIEPNKQREFLEAKKQLLGSDEVNYEQRREPYKERNTLRVCITHHHAPKHTENRNSP
jgi:hypothetical protein